MNENTDYPAPGHIDESHSQPFAFCQTCGRTLTPESARVVGRSVYCEPCLEARLGGSPNPPPPNPGPYSGVAGAPAWIPETPGTPNPGLATLLGFIPGVGAMYNEQYAKGIVHLIVFVLLVTISDSYGIFGIFIAGWEFYMAIDANHTARARRDGLPLPNPFGLNDIGERLGFGKAWPGNPNPAAAAQQATRSAAQQASQAMRDAADFAAQAAGRPPVTPYAAPVPPPPSQNPAQNPGQNPIQNPGWSPTWNPPYTGASAPPYSTPYPDSTLPPAPTPVSRFPAGAAWLIGLGCVFLLAQTDLFNAFRANAVFGLILIGLGVWLFLRRMSESGTTWHSDGTAAYRYRVFRALRVPVWLVAIGLWLMLDAFRWVRLHHTWPLILIIAGVMALLERLFFNAIPVSASPDPFTPPGPASESDWNTTHPATYPTSTDPSPTHTATTAPTASTSPESSQGGN